MNMPIWTNEKLGTMKRAGLWLVQEIGVGNTFTKGQLRDAFPDTAQIDRRMRDLRDFDWQIDTKREDVTLDAHEQRFVRQGDPVWEPGKATRKAGTVVSASQRRSLLTHDGHKCRSCGIGPGENYVGTDVTSQLDIARRPVRLADGTTELQMIIECNRCRVGDRELVADVGALLGRAAALPAIEKKILRSWLEQDRREFSEIEDLWAAFRTLPADAREQFKDGLE
ncbi:hypothetical protein ACH4SP_21870 [Streptomyces sp. NPDC021093]|uniref:hypothetical protein n=1 Tax=Streptomyces sp. NPDC021093 TaxID=3365112 RepID=UPI00378FBDB2